MSLKYTTDDTPGFSRKKCWLGFIYQDERGRKITNKQTLDRLRGLGIPPAYTRVWLCPDPNGHLQATAYDHRHRKQYFYHPVWIKNRAETKFHKLVDFAKTLPNIRGRLAEALSQPGLGKEKVIAAVIELLDTEYVRIGNEVYAQENQSFGLTTLRKRHLKMIGHHLELFFRGKSGVKHKVEIKNQRLQKIIKNCHDLPGQDLFEYLDEAHQAQPIRSEDVNGFLQELSASTITAKDFRTWHGTVIAAAHLWRAPAALTARDRRAQAKEAVKKAAEALGNTPSVCKKSYIHPLVLDLYASNQLTWRHPSQATRKKYKHLHLPEIALLALLIKHEVAS